MPRAATRPELAPVSPASHTFLSFDRMPKSELESVFLRGTTPDLEELVGWEFRGMNPPAWARLIGIKKFVKGFERRDDGVYGYNRPVGQNQLTEAWQIRDKRFGFYRVAPVDPTTRDNAYLHAVLLDYGRGGNSRFDPTQNIRDYLVQIDPRDSSLYLGKAYVALGPLRVATNFFVLERLREVGDRR